MSKPRVHLITSEKTLETVILRSYQFISSNKNPEPPGDVNQPVAAQAG